VTLFSDEPDKVDEFFGGIRE
jgi:hypothetical protein